MGGGHPVDGGFHFAPVGHPSAAGFGIVGAPQPYWLSGFGVGVRVLASQQVAGPQPHLPSRRQAVELTGGLIMKSPRSIHSRSDMGTCLVDASGVSSAGLFTAARICTLPSGQLAMTASSGLSTAIRRCAQRL